MNERTVAAKFDNVWGRKFHERVLLLVRDIANPSGEDPYFPAWRHKDWYVCTVRVYNVLELIKNMIVSR